MMGLFGNEKQVGGFGGRLTRGLLMGKQNTTLQNFHDASTWGSLLFILSRCRLLGKRVGGEGDREKLSPGGFRFNFFLVREVRHCIELRLKTTNYSVEVYISLST